MMTSVSRLGTTILALGLAADLLAGCGGSSSSNYCSGCQIYYATTNHGQIAEVQADRSGNGLDAARLFSGPSGSLGMGAAWAPEFAHVYVVDPLKQAIDVYQVDMADGTLTPASLGPYPLTGAKGTPVQMLDPGYVYVASSGGTISGFSVNSDGSLSPIPGSPFNVGAAIARECIGGGDSSTTTAYLYASEPDDADGGIASFAISADGALTPATASPFPTVAEGGPAGLESLDGRLYVALTNADAIGVYTENADGSLTAISGSPFAAGTGVSSLVQLGQYLYAGNRDSISAYAWNQTTGALTPVSGSPFAAAGTDGELVALGGDIFPPLAAASGVVGFRSAADGALTVLTTSPFPAGVTPLAAALLFFPVRDPP